MEDLRFRKATDVNREHPLFELVDSENAILIDIGLSDENELEVAFHSNIANKTFNVTELENWISIGKELVFAELSEG